jgi:hypothetical protein
MTTICGAELFIDGPVTFECDLEPGHAAPDMPFSGGTIPGSAGDQVIHCAKDRTEAGVEYQVRWTGSAPADVSCPSCGHCMAHEGDEHEPDCVVGAQSDD